MHLVDGEPGELLLDKTFDAGYGLPSELLTVQVDKSFKVGVADQFDAGLGEVADLKRWMSRQSSSFRSPRGSAQGGSQF